MRNLNNATTWLLSVFDSDLSATQKIICAYLRTHMNDHREVAWPSVGRIAAKCGLTERAVYKNLPAICAAGYLLNNGKSDSGTVRYAISTPELDSPPERRSPLNEVQYTPERRSPELTKEVTNNHIHKGKGRFKPPTVDEAAAYAKEKNMTIDPEQFVDWNQGKGWMVGKNKMKDWKAAMRTWQKREEQRHGQNRPGSGKDPRGVRVTRIDLDKDEGYVIDG